MCGVEGLGTGAEDGVVELPLLSISEPIRIKQVAKGVEGLRGVGALQGVRAGVGTLVPWVKSVTTVAKQITLHPSAGTTVAHVVPHNILLLTVPRTLAANFMISSL